MRIEKNTIINTMDKMLLKTLRKSVLEGFPKDEPPPVDQIAQRDYCEDADWLRQDFNGVKWWQADGKIILDNFAQLPFFTPAAFKYYLPAFLLYALDDFDEYNPVLGYSIYSLTPSDRPLSKTWAEERRALFSKDQREVANSFLQLILTDEALTIYHRDIQDALKFWSD